VVLSTPTPVATATQPQPTPTSTPGYNALYIGHSFGEPFAERLEDYAKNSEIDGHTQGIVFRGGKKGGNPQGLWNDEGARIEIQEILDSGDIDLLIMICGYDAETGWAIPKWIDYALSKNPDTKFGLACAWPDLPQDYPSAAEFANGWHTVYEEIWHPIIHRLKKDYPETEILDIPHGLAALELRSQFEAGTLDDVNAMVSNDGNAIFRDTKGHADQILEVLGTLVWLGSIYDVDLSVYPVGHLGNEIAQYRVDLRGIAEAIVDEERNW
jgi:hypothetical protein